MNGFEEFLATAGRKLSEEQLQVVYSDVATVVSAGAGSGKTTVLSYRFLRLVMEKKAKVDEILTLTFTKKAASEPKTKQSSKKKAVEASSADATEEEKPAPKKRATSTKKSSTKKKADVAEGE